MVDARSVRTLSGDRAIASRAVGIVRSDPWPGRGLRSAGPAPILAAMKHPATDLYPPLTPYATHELAVGDGHRLYVEECGRPDGIPAVFLHGGPGAGCEAGPSALLRSRALPHRPLRPARLRALHPPCRPGGQHHLGPGGGPASASASGSGIERWLVFGGSWGSTLALAYAADPPRAGAGPGGARHLPVPRRRRSAGSTRRGRTGSSRTTGRTSSPPSRPRSAHDLLARLSPPPDRRRRGGAHGGGQGLVDLGGAHRHPAAPTRTSRPTSPTPTWRSAWRASSATTSSTRPSWSPTNCCAMPTAWPTSPGSSSRGATTSSAPCAPPGSCTGPGRGPSSRSSRTPVTPPSSPASAPPWWRRRTASPALELTARDDRLCCSG